MASGDNPVATNLLEPHYEVKAIQHGEKRLHDRTPLFDHLGLTLAALRFRTSFWQGENGFFGRPRVFRPGQGDETPFTEPRPNPPAQGRLKGKWPLPQAVLACGPQSERSFQYTSAEFNGQLIRRDFPEVSRGVKCHSSGVS